MLIVNPNLTVHGTRYLVLGIPNTEYSVPSTVGFGPKCSVVDTGLDPNLTLY